MSEASARILNASGTPFEVGTTLGRALVGRLDGDIARWIDEGYVSRGEADPVAVSAGALPWFETLPHRFREEMAGLAEGSGLSLQRVAEWCYVDVAAAGGCSAFVRRIDGRVWIGRNNDYRVPDLWGHATIRAVSDRIPTISLGLAGEPFTATGLNAERLWLHYNWLPVTDAPRPGRSTHLPYVWLTTALETCRSLADVAALLGEVDRSGGMLLFAVDGKTDEAALFECGRATQERRDLPDGSALVATNHALALDVAAPASAGSLARHARLSELVNKVAASGSPFPPRVNGAGVVRSTLVDILADDGVEQRCEDFGTVYAAVCCPSRGELWHTFGGFPAATRGDWRRIGWPWKRAIGEGK